MVIDFIEEYLQKIVTFIVGIKTVNQFLDETNDVLNVELTAKIDEAVESARTSSNNILFSYTFRFDSHDILPIITHPSDRKHFRFYWEQPSKGVSIAGLNTIWTCNGNEADYSEDVISEMELLFKNSVSMSDFPSIGPKLIGGHAFNIAAKTDSTWDGFPRSRFFLPECLATMTADGAWLTISRFVKKGMSAEKFHRELLQLCTHYQNRMPVTLPSVTRVEVDKFRDIPNESQWKQTINAVLEEIQPGEVEKVVISRSHHIKISNEFSVSSALQVLRNMYPNCTTFMYGFPGEGIFFGSTPEQLIRLNKNYIETEALAGTQARGKNMEEDRLYSETLINSHKENEEHRLVVDQIKRKLLPLLNEIEISSAPEIMKLTNVQHLKTPISGYLKNGEHILELVNILHPTPAVAGTPTDRAMNIIQNLEKNDRGWYSGPIGWFDPNGNGEFYVALRSALVKDEEAHIFAGGGIVSESIPEKEWEETELKLLPILSALTGGQI